MVKDSPKPILKLCWCCARCNHAWLCMEPTKPPQQCPHCRKKSWWRRPQPKRVKVSPKTQSPDFYDVVYAATFGKVKPSPRKKSKRALASETRVALIKELDAESRACVSQEQAVANRKAAEAKRVAEMREFVQG